MEKKIWEKAGMSMTEYKNLPANEKGMLLRRYNGIKIYTPCEMLAIKQAIESPRSPLIVLWLQEEAEKLSIKKRYPQAIFG